MKNKSTPLKPHLLQKISYFLSGFFLTLFTFAISLKIINNLWGATFSLLIILGVSILMLKNNPISSPRRIIAIGAMTSVIILMIAFIVIWGTLQVMFQGVLK